MRGFFSYITQYNFKDMGDFLKNENKPPLDCDARLDGKTVVISGTTAGIGYATAQLLASKGARLVCLNRNIEKSQLLEADLKNRFGCEVETIIADFSSLASTKECANRLLSLPIPIDILIHNSGVYHTQRTFSADGIEIVFQVNHLSSFVLNFLLKEKLKQENRARIIHVNSEGHRFALDGIHLDDLGWKKHHYTGLKSYGAAKTAQLLVMQKFKEYFTDTEVTINAMHPGNVKTAIGDNNGKLYRLFKQNFVHASAKSPTLSAKALYFLSAAEEMKGRSGEFFNLTTPEKPAPHARDFSMINPVWRKSLELCGLT